MSNTVLISIVLVAIVAALIYKVKSWKEFEYKCPKCDHKFAQTIGWDLFPIQFYGIKLVKCPKCGKWSWINLRVKNS